MQGRFKMEYKLFTIVRYNYRDYNTEHISRELNKIELNNTTNSPLKHEIIKQTDSSEPQVNTINRPSSLKITMRPVLTSSPTKRIPRQI